MQFTNIEQISNTVYKVSVPPLPVIIEDGNLLDNQSRQHRGGVNEYFLVIYPTYRTSTWTPHIPYHETMRFIPDMWPDNKRAIIEMFTNAEGSIPSARTERINYNNMLNEDINYHFVTMHFGMGIHVQPHRPTPTYVNQPYEQEADRSWQTSVPLLPGCFYNFVYNSFNPVPTCPQSPQLVYIGRNFSTGRESFYDPEFQRIMDLDIYGNALYPHSGLMAKQYDRNGGIIRSKNRTEASERYYATNPTEFFGVPFNKYSKDPVDRDFYEKIEKDNMYMSCIFLREGQLFTYTGEIEVLYLDKSNFNKNQWSDKFSKLFQRDGESREATLLLLTDSMMTRDYLPIIDINQIKWVRTHKLTQATHTQEIPL